MKRRKPQARCKCGHAKSRHNVRYNDIVCTLDACEYCHGRCMTFTQDNLATLERLHAFKEQKEEKNSSNVSM